MRGRESLRGRAADISVGTHRIAHDSVAVEQGGAVDQQRSRLALFRGGSQPAQSADPVAAVEQQQAERRLGVEMALASGALEPGLGGGEADRDSPAEPISLAEVERGVGIARLGEWPPDLDRRVVIGALPGVDAGLDRLGSGCRGHRQQQRR